MILRISFCLKPKIKCTSSLEVAKLFQVHISFYFNKFIYLFLFLAVLGLCCCAQALFSCSKWRLLLAAACGLLIVVAFVAEHRLQARGLSSCGLWTPECRLNSCGAQAQPLCCMWDPSGPEPEPVSPALAGRLLTTAPPGKPT